MARVTGIGGIFFQAQDPEALMQWYVDNLGVELEEWGGALFVWKDDEEVQSSPGVTVWRAAEAGGDWFEPSQSSFLVNYRVDDMREMLDQLAAAGVEPVEGPVDDFNGIFTWIMDPEGNKVELWQPVND